MHTCDYCGQAECDCGAVSEESCTGCDNCSDVDDEDDHEDLEDEFDSAPSTCPHGVSAQLPCPYCHA